MKEIILIEMFRLPLPDTKDLDQYFELIKDDISDRLNSSSLSDEQKRYFTKARLKQIIVDPPHQLMDYHSEIMILLVPTFSSARFEDYKAAKKKRNPSVPEMNLINLYSITQELGKIFAYDKIISSSKELSYQLSEKLGRETCTYCNRLYAQTIIIRNKKTGSVAKTGRITRPDFDHWFFKSKYPALALSYYNLIPSCGVCNSSIKGSTEFLLSTHVHPYVHESGQTFSFKYNLEQVHENNVKVVCAKNSKIENTIKAFKIQEVYDAHSALELKDLLDMRYKYSENYLDTLLSKTFKSLEMSKQEAYRLIFGVESDEKEFHKRPFSKFKKDILASVGIKI